MLQQTTNTPPDRKKTRLLSLLFRWIRFRLIDTLPVASYSNADLDRALAVFERQFSEEWCFKVFRSWKEPAWVLEEWHAEAWEKIRVHEAGNEMLAKWGGSVETRRMLE